MKLLIGRKKSYPTPEGVSTGLDYWGSVVWPSPSWGFGTLNRGVVTRHRPRILADVGPPAGGGPLQQPQNCRTDLMGLLPDLLKSAVGPVSLLRAEACQPGRPPMGKGAQHPVQAEEESPGSAWVREDREVRRPSGKGGGPELQPASMQEALNPAQRLPLPGIHEESKGLFLEGLCIDFRHEDSEAAESGQFSL